MQTQTYLPERKGAYAARVRATDIDYLGIDEQQTMRLKNEGIRTLGQLKTWDPKELASRMEIASLSVRRWQAFADLMEVNGIGKEHGRLLVDSGIDGVDDLLRRDREAVLYTVVREEAVKSSSRDGNSPLESLSITGDLVDRWFTRAVEVA